MKDVSLESFLDRVGSADRRLVVVGVDGDDPLAAMLAETLDSSIEVAGASAGSDLADETETDEPTVVLVEDGEVRATSPMSAVYDAVLGVNSDLFVTGARGMDEVSMPDVLAGLENHRFRLRGYPCADKEKLLLIVVSRWIERLAGEQGAGTLRSAFQDLSRIDDEAGTREVYETLAGTGVEAHLYGFGGSDRLDRLGSVHRGESDAYRRSWFVVFRPPAEESEVGAPIEGSGAGSFPDGAALVAVELEPGLWEGFWTTEPRWVREIDDHVAEEL